MKLMGILNITPDSFSDGGRIASPALAQAAIEQLISDGADIIDIGAESTRPGATPVSPAEERARLAPVLALVGRYAQSAQFSLDTRHAETARAGLESGCTMINDVSGGADPALVALAAHGGASLVMMHSLGIPADPARTLPEGSDPIAIILKWGADLLARLGHLGIGRERVYIDPGLGFGKTAAQSGQIVERIGELKALGAPILVGHSRKSFMSVISGQPSDLAWRDAQTLALSFYLMMKEVDCIRVHDVATHYAMLNMKP